MVAVRWQARRSLWVVCRGSAVSALAVHCLRRLQQMHWAVGRRQWAGTCSLRLFIHYPPLPLSSLWLGHTGFTPVAHTHFLRSLTPTDHNKTRGILRRKSFTNAWILSILWCVAVGQHPKSVCSTSTWPAWSPPEAVNGLAHHQLIRPSAPSDLKSIHCWFTCSDSFEATLLYDPHRIYRHSSAFHSKQFRFVLQVPVIHARSFV